MLKIQYLERELVHRIDFKELIENKVEKRGPGCSWTVVLSGFIDLNFSYFSLLHFLGNLGSRCLGGFKVLNKSSVAQEIPLCKIFQNIYYIYYLYNPNSLNFKGAKRVTQVVLLIFISHILLPKKPFITIKFILIIYYMIFTHVII